MKKKILGFITMFTLLISLFGVKVYAEEEVITGETVVKRHDNYKDLPIHFTKEKGISTYMYKNDGVNEEEIYDFRAYFLVLDNRVDILDMHSFELDEVNQTFSPIDKGGYVWDFGGFDLDVLGEYTIRLTYEGKSSTESATIDVEVIAEDIEAPYGDIVDQDFNITKTDEQFQEELENFLLGLKIYDKVDGLIPITKSHFSEEDLEALKNATFSEGFVILTLNVSDEAGNVFEVVNEQTGEKELPQIKLTIVDSLGPTIQNVKTIVIRKNTRRPRFFQHLAYEDNYSPTEKINVIIEVFGTMVRKNVWKYGPQRVDDSKGDLLKSYVRLNDIDDLLNDVKTNEVRVSYGVGDYYQVNFDAQPEYVYVKSKTEPDAENKRENIWEKTTNASELTGKLIEEYDVITHSKEDFQTLLDEEKEVEFNKDDYYRVRDLVGKENYFMYISEKENDYRDSQGTTLTTSKAGVQYVKITATDEFDNEAVVYYRVVIENSVSLLTMALIVNAILIVAAGAVLFVIYFKPLFLNKKKEL